MRDMTTMNYDEIYTQIQEAPITGRMKQKAFNLLSEQAWPLQHGYLVTDGFTILSMTVTTEMIIEFYAADKGEIIKDVDGKVIMDSTFTIKSKTK
jgi:hypothetical protein